MLEMRLVHGSLWKKALGYIMDLQWSSTDGNISLDCDENGFSVQATISKHAVLVSLLLKPDACEDYQCDCKMSMGMKLKNMTNMLEGTTENDIMNIKADDGGHSIRFLFENSSQKTISDFEMKLLDIDCIPRPFRIPDSEYDAIVRMPSSELLRIWKGLSAVGKTVDVSVTRKEVKFTASGHEGTANFTCRHDTDDKRRSKTATVIDMKKAVSLVFELPHCMVITFVKAKTLSHTVTLSMSMGKPVSIEYKIAEIGSFRIRLALAPSIHSVPAPFMTSDS